MAYSRVTRTQNGKGALDYAYGFGKGHNENEMRNQLVIGVNLFEGVPYLEQMQGYWNKARDGHKTQVLRLVTSFSKNELDPENPADIEKASLIQQKLLQKRYPNRQAVIFVQTDGKSGLVHTHTIINDVEMDNYKGCDKEQYHFEHVKKWTNEVAKKYIDLDSGKGKTEDKTTQTERAKREQGVYVWKDDLKNRVHDAMLEAESEQDFEDKLPQHGVNFEKKSSKKYGVGYTYELVDLSNVPAGTKVPNRALKARSRNLGDSYGIEALNYVLQLKSNAQQEVIEDDIAHEIEDEVYEPADEIIEDIVATEVVNPNPFTKLSHEQLRKALDEFNLERTGISVPDEEKSLKSPNTASNDSDTVDEQPELNKMDNTDAGADDTQYQQFIQQTIRNMQEDSDENDLNGHKTKLNMRLRDLQSKFGNISEDTQEDDEYTR